MTSPADPSSTSSTIEEIDTSDSGTIKIVEELLSSLKIPSSEEAFQQIKSQLMNYPPVNFNAYNAPPFYGSQQLMQSPVQHNTQQCTTFPNVPAPRFYGLTYNYSSPNFQYRDPGIFPEDDRSYYGCSPEQFPSPQGYEDASNQSSPANIPSNEMNNKWTIGGGSSTCSPLPRKDEDDEEKRNSTLWKMINEINDMDELAISMSGTKPIPNLKAEDVEEFERSADDVNIQMPTDDLVINLDKEDARIYKDL